MNKDKVKLIKEFEYLKSQVKKHQQAYHQDDDPIISDAQYDDLCKSLLTLEKKIDGKKKSAYENVGYEPKKIFREIPHKIPMLSLDNIFESEELKSFFNKISKALSNERNFIGKALDYSVELKLDGLAVSLMYEHGKLIYAATRGNGILGEDVTKNILTIKEIPKNLNIKKNEIFKQIKTPELLEVRGEIFITKKDFEILNFQQEKKGLKIFSNPRNAASGSVRQLDQKIVSERPLRFFVHSIGESKPKLTENFSKYSEVIKWFSSLGFPVCDTRKAFLKTSNIWSFIDFIGKNKHNFDFEIDGAVIKLENLSYQQILGSTARAPKHSIAFKFPSDEVITKLLDIEVQVGRTGSITPVAKLNPVKIGGVVISNATLHNEDELLRKNIKIGDYVRVRRAGDVIPEVLGAVIDLRDNGTRFFKMPSNCPVCGSKIYREEGESTIRCIAGLKCSAQKSQALLHFVSKNCLNVDGLGEKLVNQLIRRKILNTFSDFFTLDRDSIISLDRMGAKSADNLLVEIEKAKKSPLHKIINGLGIRFVGDRTSNALSKRFKTLKSLSNATFDEFIEIDDIGPVVAKSLISFFSTKENKKMIDDLSGHIILSIDNESKKNTLLNDKTILITGSLENMSRLEAKSLIEINGGSLTSSVSSKVDLVVVGKSPGSKITKALELDLKIISDADFFLLLKK